MDVQIAVKYFMKGKLAEEKYLYLPYFVSMLKEGREFLRKFLSLMV